ncbi:ATP-binding protein [Schwartzia sp. (in: firmicutes)]
MQQKIFKLFFDESTLKDKEEKELKGYIKEIKSLVEKPEVKCGFLKVMFQGIFLPEAERITKLLQKQLPKTEVVGVSKTYFEKMKGRRYIELCLYLTEKSVITAIDYKGVPEDFAALGEEIGQRLAETENLKAVELYVSGLYTEFIRLIEKMSDTVPSIPVFGAIAGMFYRYRDELLQESLFEMIARELSMQMPSSRQRVPSGYRKIADAVYFDLPVAMGEAEDAEEMNRIFSGFMKKLEDEYDLTMEQYIITDSGMHEGILLILFCGEELYAHAEHVLGWKQLGKEMVITETFGNNCLAKIDDEPATDIYRRYLGVEPGKTLFFANIFEFPMVIERDGVRLARVPFFYDSRHRLYMTGDVHEGERIRLAYGNPQEIIQESWRSSLSMEIFAPQAVILSVCTNRQSFLGESVGMEMQAFERLVPECSMMFGQAEIFRQHKKGGIFTNTLVALGLREGEAQLAFEEEELPHEESPVTIIPLATRLATFLDATIKELEEKNDALEEMAHALADKTQEYGHLVEKADAANIAKSQFLSNMSHEIRTPINAVLGMDEMILRETKEPFTREYAENIRGAGNSLLSLINDILDFSKIESGRMDIIPVEYALSSVLNDIMNMLSKRAGDKGLRFIIEVDPFLPSVIKGDEIRIKQILTNIITNGIKYTEKGQITLRVREKSRHDGNVLLYFEVKDTGIGIKKEDIPKLFSAFERIEEERNRTIEGTGLGMNITQRLLALMGTKLQVESTYGKGSKFFFELEQPIMDDTPMGNFSDAVRRMMQNEVYHESFTAPSAHILVVDDTEMNLTVVKGLLKQTKLNIDTANSGAEALRLMDRREYDVVFLDHRMPIMDGIETLRAFKEGNFEHNKTTPVISLTANAVSGAREMYMKEGFTDYLTKPINSHQLEAMLVKYLPPEKVKVSMVEQNAEEEEALPNWLFGMRDLDVKSGVENCGSSTAYISTLKVFYESIPDTLREIQDSFDKEDWKNYTIKVHALKSTSRIIGANELSERAKRLENAGNAGYIEEIKKDTEAMLDLYRSYQKLLSMLGSDEKEDSDKPLISDAELNEAIGTIKELVEQFDYDSLGYVFEELAEYSLPAEVKEWMEKVKTAAMKPDWDEAKRLLKEGSGDA